MKVKIQYIVGFYIFVFALLLYACRANCAITRPLINDSILSWSGYRAYKTMVNAEDEYSFTRAELSDVITEAKVNQRWARQTVKKLKLSRYSTHMERVERILQYISRKLRYKRTQPFLTVGISTKRGNCACYSDMLYILCKAAGYHVRYVIGYLDGTCHAWNKVRINSKWYWVDPTLYDSTYGTDYYPARKLWSDHSDIIEIW